jgi:hypothetical protein
LTRWTNRKTSPYPRQRSNWISGFLIVLNDTLPNKDIYFQRAAWWQMCLFRPTANAVWGGGDFVAQFSVARKGRSILQGASVFSWNEPAQRNCKFLFIRFWMRKWIFSVDFYE